MNTERKSTIFEIEIEDYFGDIEPEFDLDDDDDGYSNYTDCAITGEDDDEETGCLREVDSEMGEEGYLAEQEDTDEEDDEPSYNHGDIDDIFPQMDNVDNHSKLIEQLFKLWYEIHGKEALTQDEFTRYYRAFKSGLKLEGEKKYWIDLFKAKEIVWRRALKHRGSKRSHKTNETADENLFGKGYFECMVLNPDTFNNNEDRIIKEYVLFDLKKERQKLFYRENLDVYLKELKRLYVFEIQRLNLNVERSIPPFDNKILTLLLTSARQLTLLDDEGLLPRLGINCESYKNCESLSVAETLIALSRVGITKYRLFQYIKYGQRFVNEEHEKLLFNSVFSILPKFRCSKKRNGGWTDYKQGRECAVIKINGERKNTTSNISNASGKTSYRCLGRTYNLKVVKPQEHTSILKKFGFTTERNDYEEEEKKNKKNNLDNSGTEVPKNGNKGTKTSFNRSLELIKFFNEYDKCCTIRESDSFIVRYEEGGEDLV